MPHRHLPRRGVAALATDARGYVLERRDRASKYTWRRAQLRENPYVQRWDRPTGYWSGTPQWRGQAGSADYFVQDNKGAATGLGLIVAWPDSPHPPPA